MDTMIGIVIGAVITWFCSWWYYRRAGQELRDEARELRRITILVLQALQNAGIAQINWDAAGGPTGMNIVLQAGPAPGTRLEAPPAHIISDDPPSRKL